MAAKKKKPASESPVSALDSIQAIHDAILQQEKARQVLFDQAQNRLDKELVKLQIKRNAAKEKVITAKEKLAATQETCRGKKGKTVESKLAKAKAKVNETQVAFRELKEAMAVLTAEKSAIKDQYRYQVAKAKVLKAFEKDWRKAQQLKANKPTKKKKPSKTASKKEMLNDEIPGFEEESD
tara:strand:+ start:86 stop:628 length:543 start_codon:yes stop_codon:yes gene_type:complete